MSNRIARKSTLVRPLFALAALALLFAAPEMARAELLPAPEIDPGSMAGAMTLLIGGVLAVVDRARRS